VPRAAGQGARGGEAAQAKLKAQQLELAAQKMFFELLMPGLMPLLGVLAAAAVTPLFEMLGGSLRRRPK
jgi:hypothetical protein